jgi:hypothetical protein
MKNNYLIGYGSCNFLGCFVPKNAGHTFLRGDRVVIQSERGKELGTVLMRTDELALPPSLNHIPGEIIGPAEQADETNAQALAEKSVVAFGQARTIVRELAPSLEIIDVEVIGEPDAYVFHLVRFDEAPLQTIQDALSQCFHGKILFHNVSDWSNKVAEVSCGAEGCGSGNCSSKGGCANGTCGSGCGSSKAFPDQWRAYFAQLREQMELQKKQALLVE